MEIISEARKLERKAEKAYSNLAAQLEDPQGHEMFVRLSEEEHKHFEILSEAFWSLNQTGVWKYASP
jgi:rubrerythrin